MFCNAFIRTKPICSIQTFNTSLPNVHIMLLRTTTSRRRYNFNSFNFNSCSRISICISMNHLHQHTFVPIKFRLDIRVLVYLCDAGEDLRGRALPLHDNWTRSAATAEDFLASFASNVKLAPFCVWTLCERADDVLLVALSAH